MNVISLFPSSDEKQESLLADSGFNVPELYTTENWVVKYSFLEPLSASVSTGAMIDYFKSQVEYSLIFPTQTHWFEYFRELLTTLLYAKFKVEWNNVFLLPENTLDYIHANVCKLNIFECKNIIVQIDRITDDIVYNPQLCSSYNYIRSVVFTRFEELRKAKKDL